jgi:hypothetical protein
MGRPSPLIALLPRRLYNGLMAGTNPRRSAVPPRATLVAGALVAISLLAAACGGGSHPSGVASLGKTTLSSPVAGGVATTLPSGAAAEEHYQKALKYSECMRSQGISNFPDPNSGGGIQLGSNSGIDPQSLQFQAAQKACPGASAGPRVREMHARQRCTQFPRPSVRRERGRSGEASSGGRPQVARLSSRHDKVQRLEGKRVSLLHG